MENPGLSDSKLCVGHGMIHFVSTAVVDGFMTSLLTYDWKRCWENKISANGVVVVSLSLFQDSPCYLSRLSISYLAFRK